ncbi:MAG: hypothetical protein KGL93_13270 [Gemmatimonadota bacterium]|nr:hypothetical protein [Gemmatimonadota bacterium]
MPTITGVARVDALLDALSELSDAEWQTMGRLALSLHRGAAAGTAELLAGALIADQGLEVRLWYALDAMQTCAALSGRPPRDTTRESRALCAASLGAARCAVMAELAGCTLPPRDHALLSAPAAATLAGRPAPPRLQDRDRTP